MESRTVAGPSSTVQCVLSGGPYTVWSHFAGGVDVFRTCAIPSAVCASSQRVATGSAGPSPCRLGISGRSPQGRGPDPGPRRVDCPPLKTSHLAIAAFVSASIPASSALRPSRLTKAAWPLAHGSGHGVAAWMRCGDGGLRSSRKVGRIGRGHKLPPQLGQIPIKWPSTQRRQKVHS